MTTYPVNLPLDAVQKLIEIVKSKKLVERKAEFGLAAWNVQGFGQKMLLGNPDTVPITSSIADDADLLLQLAETLVAHSESATYAVSSEQEALDLNTIMALISAILEILKSLGILKFKTE